MDQFSTTWKFVKETVVCAATIFIRTFGTLLLGKNSDVKGSPIIEASVCSCH